MKLSNLQIELLQSLGGFALTLVVGAVIVCALAVIVKYTPTKIINKIF